MYRLKKLFKGNELYGGPDNEQDAEIINNEVKINPIR